MKHMFLACLLVLAGASVAFGQPTAYQDSAKIENLFDNYFREYLRLNPEKGTELGLPKESPYKFNRAGLNDVSPAGIKANYDLARKYLNQLKEIAPTKITRSQSIDAKILTWFLEIKLEEEKFADHKYQIDHLFGVHSQLTNLLTEYHTIEDIQDAEDYLKRMEKIPISLRQVMEHIDAQEGKGIRPPVFIIDRVIADMGAFKRAESDSNILYLDFRDKLAALSGVGTSIQGNLGRKVRSVIQRDIYPAYDQFIMRLRASTQYADSLPGLWKLPDGDKYYAYCLKFHTSTSMSPKEVFKLGQKEVKALQEKARILLDSLGISGDTTFGALMNQYWATWQDSSIRDKFYYPEGEETRQMVLSDYQGLLDSALARLPEAFSYMHKTPVTVEAVPEHREGSGLTYYEPASLDGRRRATFHVNMGYVFAKPGMPSLLYHETVPGHHYQFAVQQELTQGQMFKNLFFITGFAEGWAMYVQSLAMELGWLPDMYSRIAELNSQLFRAVRIVVDAGIHYKKWSKNEAAQYMYDNLGWSSDNEIDRYIVWPGQACSYTTGRLKIMELREKAKKELGPKFDLKEFHMTVLENGSLPLDLLEEVVDDYIRMRK
ncbi:MAG: DUF885 domain-containing protein [Candidatus Zixiibacteriota bacterium]